MSVLDLLRKQQSAPAEISDDEKDEQLPALDDDIIAVPNSAESGQPMSNGKAEIQPTCLFSYFDGTKVFVDGVLVKSC